jgi:hypothetical protein
VGDPPKGALARDRVRRRDALMDEPAPREVADPAAQQRVVEPLDVERDSGNQCPRIHERSASDADRDPACQELDDVIH